MRIKLKEFGRSLNLSEYLGNDLLLHYFSDPLMSKQEKKTVLFPYWKSNIGAHFTAQVGFSEQNFMILYFIESQDSSQT